MTFDPPVGGETLTSVALVSLVPASELLALDGGDVGVVGAVDDGRDHALIGRRGRERETERQRERE